LMDHNLRETPKCIEPVDDMEDRFGGNRAAMLREAIGPWFANRGLN